MELVEVKDIPTRSGRGGVAYPWNQWLAQLQNGKALKLGREDVPEGSNALRHWDDVQKRRGAFSTARRLGLEFASRGDYIYLWKE